MDDEGNSTFYKYLESVEYDHGKDSNRNGVNLFQKISQTESTNFSKLL